MLSRLRLAAAGGTQEEGSCAQVSIMRAKPKEGKEPMWLWEGQGRWVHPWVLAWKARALSREGRAPPSEKHTVVRLGRHLAKQ